MLGDHDLWGKTSCFDAAFHTPLVIRDPRAPSGHGTQVSAPTESIDLMPTILERIGLTPPDTVDGHSLCTFLDGASPEKWRAHTFSELDYGDPVSPGPVQRALRLDARDANLALLRTGAQTLVHFNGGLPAMLFDHAAEGEQRDCADAAPECVLRLTRAMLDHRMSHPQGRFAHTMITPTGVRTTPRHGPADAPPERLAQVS